MKPTLKSLVGLPEEPVKWQSTIIAIPAIRPNAYPKSVMNELERKYSWHLQHRLLAGEISAWWHEPDVITLGYRCTYRPDFKVKMPHGGFEYHETKGFMQDDAAVKLAVSAMLHPQTPFVVVEWKKKSWKLSVVDSNPTLKSER